MTGVMTTDAHVPTCIGIIMDGNRRWAKSRGVSTMEGHAAGRDTLKECVRWAKEAGVQHMIFYAFSTENWNRTQEEVSSLMNLLERALKSDFEALKKEHVRVRFIGDRDRFSESIQVLMRQWEEETVKNTEGTLVLALSYGGRSEIVRAANRQFEEALGDPISEERLAEKLDTAGIPDPELIIRTGGQKRLSNFLLWQAAYSELFFLDTYWPDFSKEEFKRVLEEFAVRKRNFGA